MRVDTHTVSAAGPGRWSDQTRRKPMTTIASNHKAVRHNLSRPAREPTRLLVVDDHAAVRAGVRDILADQPDFEVVAAVATAEDALSVAEHRVIDLAVVDYQLVGRTGLWLSRKLKRLRQPPG